MSRLPAHTGERDLVVLLQRYDPLGKREIRLLVINGVT